MLRSLKDTAVDKKYLQMIGSIIGGMMADMAFTGFVDRYFYKKDYSTMEDKERQIRSDAVIKNHMVWSMGAGFIPIPFADILAVTAIQIDMVRNLATIYDVEFKESQGKALITTLTGSTVARISANALKFIPGVGTVLGGVTMSVLSGASTFGVGEVFKRHFKTGGTFLDFDPERLRKMYREKFEKGKKMAAEMKKKEQKESEPSPQPEPPSDSEVVQRLTQLNDLKAQGIITDDEFALMKERLMQQFNAS